MKPIIRTMEYPVTFGAVEIIDGIPCVALDFDEQSKEQLFVQAPTWREKRDVMRIYRLHKLNQNL